MAKYTHFEELPVWQDAARLYNLVLDLLEASPAFITPGFRNQLDRAALSVSNNVAEGFDRVTTAELLCFIGTARGLAGEVRSMITVVLDRPKVRPYLEQLKVIRSLAESCAKQMTAWRRSIEDSSVQGKRHLSATARRQRQVAEKARSFR